jgi:hypothetical protein
MNYPVDEIDVLLAKLADERKRVEDERGATRPFETMVIPNAMPSRELDEQLAAKGVTSTIALAWPVGDPAFASLDAKREAMAAYATDRF